MTTPWEQDLGTYQGRIPVSGAPVGTYVFELGHALMASCELAPGDYQEVSQDVYFSNQSKLVRCSVRIVLPSLLPSGRRWIFSMIQGYAERVRRVLTAGRRIIVLRDMAVQVNTYEPPPGFHQPVTFRLKLE